MIDPYFIRSSLDGRSVLVVRLAGWQKELSLVYGILKSCNFASKVLMRIFNV